MNNFSRTFLFFLTTYRAQTLIVIFLLALAGLAEAIGVAAFLPFLQIVLEGEASLDHLPEGTIRDLIINSGIPVNFLSVSIFIISAISAKALILWIALRKVGRTVAHISADLRKRLMAALMKANWKFFVGNSLGTSLNAVVMETYRSSMAFLYSARFLAALVQFSVYAISAYILSWQLFLGALIVGSSLMFILWSLVRTAQKSGFKQTNLAKEMLERMAEMLQGIKSLRAMALENKFMNILSSHSNDLETAQTNELVSTQCLRVLYEPLMVITAILGLFAAMHFSGLQGGELALMAVIFIRLLGSMNNLQSEYQKMVVQESALWSLIDTIEKTEHSVDEWSGSGAAPKNIKDIQ
ncbi:MAG: ABC transporter transmembrane domain-containing protein, partial [Pseudomonadota bacterium]